MRDYFTYIIMENYPPIGGTTTWSIYFNDEHEIDCNTLSEAYVYLAKHMQECALLEMEQEGKPCLTT